MRSRLAVEDLLRVIDLCRVVGNKGSDPFQVDVESSLKLLKHHLPDWNALNELLLDSDAINSISSIVRLQDEWLKHRASSLYVDPVLVELKIRLSDDSELARALAKSIHPIVHLSQIFPLGLKKAFDYWNNLTPFAERDLGLGAFEELPAQQLTFLDLVRMRVLSDEEFQKKLHTILGEAQRDSNEGRIDYFRFVQADSFDESVLRAYIVSFLVSDGHLAVEVDSIEEKTWLRIQEKHEESIDLSLSVATQLSYESWSRR